MPVSPTPRHCYANSTYCDSPRRQSGARLGSPAPPMHVETTSSQRRCLSPSHRVPANRGSNSAARLTQIQKDHAPWSGGHRLESQPRRRDLSVKRSDPSLSYAQYASSQRELRPTSVSRSAAYEAPDDGMLSARHDEALKSSRSHHDTTAFHETTEHDHIETRASTDPFLSKGKQHARRAVAGLAEGRAGSFCDSCEFVSLGCFCAVAHALQALGLKRHTYPFDWNRSPADGIISCLNNGFADFLTHSIQQEGPQGVVFGATAWGGSFWHHNITLQKVQEDFARRISRFHGHEEVPVTTPRVFVRAANTTEELKSTLALMRALRTVFPKTKIYLLVLVDLQSATGLIRVDEAEDCLFARVHESLFEYGSKNWTIEKHSHAYTEAISKALHFWAGSTQPDAEVATLQELEALVDPFDGGSTADSLFHPLPTSGVQTTLKTAIIPSACTLSPLDQPAVKVVRSMRPGTSTPTAPGSTFLSNVGRASSIIRFESSPSRLQSAVGRGSRQSLSPQPAPRVRRC